MIALMRPDEFRALYRMNCPSYMWAMNNPNGNEMCEQKATDSISEAIQAGQVMLAYLKRKEFNPMTLVYFYPEMRRRIDGGEELFRMATGIGGVTTMPNNQFKELVKIIGEDGMWCTTNRIEKAKRVVDVLKQYGFQCRLTPEALDAGMNKQKYYTQGPDDYLDFILSFHSALAMIESDTSHAVNESPQSI